MSRTRHHLRLSITALVAFTALTLLAACAGGNRGSAGGGAGGGGGAGQDSYVSLYARGDYAAAKSTALAAAGGASGTERDRANLIAGLSAAQLNQNSEASRLLEPLSTSADREIAGRATAGLGLITRNQGDKARGASLMAEGAKKLSGDIGAKAFLAAGDTYAEIGSKEQALAQYNAGMALATQSDLKAALQERLQGKRFVVQVGAFASRANADKKAGEIRSRAVSLGLGVPKVQQALNKGKASYLVQVGNFPSKQEARLACAKVGGGAVVAETDF